MTLVRYFILIFFLSFLSCQNTVEKSSKAIAEIYELVLMKSSFKKESQQTSKTLEWKEKYVFNQDSSFQKIRIHKGQTTTASGSYKTELLQGEGTGYMLSYDTSYSIVGSCTGSKDENLLLRPDGKLQNSWMMCDGPFLVYEKK